jgi:hypothetical protein
MLIRVLNLNDNVSYNFSVNNTTTMKNIKDSYVRELNLNVDKLIVWISSDIFPLIKKEWPSDFDHLTLTECNILKPDAKAFIIIKSV